MRSRCVYTSPFSEKRLSLYGFKRVVEGENRGSYYHRDFLRHLPEACDLMQRGRRTILHLKQAKDGSKRDDSVVPANIGKPIKDMTHENHPNTQHIDQKATAIKSAGCTYFLELRGGGTMGAMVSPDKSISTGLATAVGAVDSLLVQESNTNIFSDSNCSRERLGGQDRLTTIPPSATSYLPMRRRTEPLYNTNHNIDGK